MSGIVVFVLVFCAVRVLIAVLSGELKPAPPVEKPDPVIKPTQITENHYHYTSNHIHVKDLNEFSRNREP